MWLAWCLFVASWAAYVVSATVSARHSGREALEVLSVAAGATALFFARSHWNGTSLHGALLSASLAALSILALTRGRPTRMFDPKPPRPPLTPGQERSFRRRKRAVRLHQTAFLVIVVAFFTFYGFSGATFLE